MAIAMNLWSIDDKKSLNLIPKSKIELEKQLEDWIIDDPTLLDLDFIIIGRQVHTDHGGYIDILACSSNTLSYSRLMPARSSGRNR